jgi:hypothetical protein
MRTQFLLSQNRQRTGKLEIRLVHNSRRLSYADVGVEN